MALARDVYLLMGSKDPPGVTTTSRPPADRDFGSLRGHCELHAAPTPQNCLAQLSLGSRLEIFRTTNNDPRYAFHGRECFSRGSLDNGDSAASAAAVVDAITINLQEAKAGNKPQPALRLFHFGLEDEEHPIVPEERLRKHATSCSLEKTSTPEVWAALRPLWPRFGFKSPIFEDHLHFEKSPNLQLHQTEHSYRITTSVVDLVWTYFPHNQSTVAIVTTIDIRGRDATSQFINLLIDHGHLVEQPMFLALVAQTNLMPRTEWWLKVHISDVVKAMQDTGFYHHLVMIGGDQRGSRDIDYGTLAAETGGAAVNLSTSTCWWQGFVDMAEMIQRETEAHLHLQQSLHSRSTVAATNPSLQSLALALFTSQSTALQRTAAHQHHAAQRLLQKSQSWHAKASLQLTAIQSLTSQQSQSETHSLSAATHALATASKRDSTAMKAIAAVTMVFLPGTFVASLFAVPVFDWHADRARGEGVVGARFWVYWAVTLPLTAATVLCYVVWMGWLDRRERRVDLNGGGKRAGAGSEDGGAGDGRRGGLSRSGGAKRAPVRRRLKEGVPWIPMDEYPTKQCV